MREDGGKFELSFNSTSDPSTVFTIDEWNWKSEPIFSETPSSEIRNKIRAVYDLDWSGIFKGRKFGDYKKQTERPNAASITKYGELSEDVEFPAIQVQAMAEDVADWIVLQKKDVIPVMRVPVDHSARKVERGDYVLLLHDISTYNNTKWRVLEITEIPSKQTYLIEAIQFMAS